MNNQGMPIQMGRSVDTTGTPDVRYRRNEFDSAIYKLGYPAYVDYFIPCPCKEKGVHSANLTCKNCFGSGFVLIKRMQTKLLLSQMNRSTEYKDWSVENMGTVSVTLLSEDPISLMDRVVLYTESSQYTELIYPRFLEEGKSIGFCTYPPIEIEVAYLYNGDTNKLEKIDTSNIEIDNQGKLNFKGNLENYLREEYIHSSEPGISLKYRYHPSYHIIDIPRNLMTSPVENTLTKNVERQSFPIHAMGRMSHMVLERGNLINFPDGMISNLEKSTTMLELMQDNLDINQKFCFTEK